MTLDLGRIISHTFSLSWRHKWLWLLGVFGGGAGFTFGGPNFGFNGSFNTGPGSYSTRVSSEQVNAFIRDHLALIIAASIAFFVFFLVILIVSSIAVPASVWSAVTLDGGGEARLGEAWGQGTRRFWAVLRLLWLRILLGLVVAVVGALLVFIGLLVYAAAGPASLWALIPLGILLFLALLAGGIVVSLALAWSERMLVLLGLGAVESMKASWWIFWRHKLDTFVFALVMGIITTGIGIAAVFGAVILAIPGIALLVGGLVGNQVGVAAAGVVLLVLLAGALLILAGGYAGSVVQVSYALAARDLCLRHGIKPDLESSPSGRFVAPPADAVPLLPPGVIPPPPSAPSPPPPPPPPG